MSKAINVERVTTKARHTTTFKLVLLDEHDEPREEELRVIYSGISLRGAREMEQEIDAAIELDARRAAMRDERLRQYDEACRKAEKARKPLPAAPEEDEHEPGSAYREALINQMVKTVLRLPDLVDGEGQETKPSVEFFETLDTSVLNTMSNAIKRHREAGNSSPIGC